MLTQVPQKYAQTGTAEIRSHRY
uniref:Uncharacterized protein n=1 Tax=Anguilla anguilla TaxID=7936 RepID=A0A0E9UHJ3_ANGAN